MRFSYEIYAQVWQAGKRLQHRIDEAVVGRIAETHYALLLTASCICIVVEKVRRAKDVDQGNGSEGGSCGVGCNCEGLLRHLAAPVTPATAGLDGGSGVVYGVADAVLGRAKVVLRKCYG